TGKPVRMITVTAMDLRQENEEGEQFSLFGEENGEERARNSRLEEAKDGIRRRFGKRVLTIGSAVGNPLLTGKDSESEKEDGTDE
ncbi:MAG: hypothetical protein MJ078_07275, partial [Clostridia bacterium]|nr:hypothetical protein [Clostridia bacterium]